MSNKINEYQDIFNVDDYDCAHLCKVKMKIIQGMTQIERPSGWNLDQINLINNYIKKLNCTTD